MHTLIEIRLPIAHIWTPNSAELICSIAYSFSSHNGLLAGLQQRHNNSHGSTKYTQLWRCSGRSSPLPQTDWEKIVAAGAPPRAGSGFRSTVQGEESYPLVRYESDIKLLQLNIAVDRLFILPLALVSCCSINHLDQLGKCCSWAPCLSYYGSSRLHTITVHTTVQ